MENCIKLKKQNPLDRASWLSRITFLWILDCTVDIKKEEFKLEDLPRCSNKVLSKVNGNILQKKWDEEIQKMAEKQSAKPSLLKIILKLYGYEIFKYGLWMFLIFVVIKSCHLFLLSELIKLFMNKDYTINDMVIYGGTLCFIIYSHSFGLHHIYHAHTLLSHRIKAAVTSMVYRKILKLSQKSFNEIPSGKILNLLSNDISRFEALSCYHSFWIIPFQVVAIVAVLWFQYGFEILIGIVLTIILLIPLQVNMGRLVGKNFQSAAANTDTRIKMMNEIYSGMELIKMYTWENPFKEKIQETRHDELKYISNTCHIKGILNNLIFLIEKLGLFFAVVSYSLLGYPVLANVLFSVSTCFRTLQNTFGVLLPIALATGTELLVSVRRLEEFLLLEEKENSENEILNKEELGEIRLEKLTASYSQHSIQISCSNVDIARGSLTAVVGPVGSGKSSFLKVILGELSLEFGSLSVNGVISFSSQKPWIFSSTIRKNIVFDQDFDDYRYKEVIRVCGLTEDLAQLPNSDQTVVGSRGVTLSGGQRARINLARAVYKKSDIYLLDDVLSALDAKVGNFVFEECIMKFLEEKTRVYVTHQMQYLKQADHILIFAEGTLEAQGSFQEFFDSDPYFTNLFSPAEDSNIDHEHHEIPIQKDKLKSFDISSTLPTTKQNSEVNMKMENDMMQGQEVKIEKCDSVLWAYVKSSQNVFGVVAILFGIFFGQVFLNIGDYWVTLWSEQEMMRKMAQMGISKGMNVSNTQYAFENIFNHTIFSTWIDRILIGNVEHITLKIPKMRLIYFIIIVISVTILTTKSYVMVNLWMEASRNIHNKVIGRFFDAPIKFFNVNPPGYTINIFSKDLAVIDSQVPFSLMNLSRVIPLITGSLCLVFSSNYYMITLFLPMFWMAVRLTKWYIVPFLTYKRIEVRAKTPIFTHVISAIDGIETIRATKSENCIIDQFHEYQDIQTSASVIALSCNSALGLWLDSLCITFVSCLIVMFAVMDKYTYISGSFIGLAIFQATSLVGPCQFTSKCFSEILGHVTSMERVLTFSKLEKEEESEKTGDNQLIVDGISKKWPSVGKISISDLYLRYEEKEDPVLHNLNLEILPNEKIGIAGRTGAGKSSIISALFRLSPFEGTIIIDGVDTKTIGLKRLREKISIIPQEPMLFSGTIRYNLDPFDKYPDAKIWRALRDVELGDTIKSLNIMVTQGGNNFSVGQKQLICLARALLKENKIVILDEATANVDSRTDELIQKTIRKKFKHCTVLTVAHRLSSIMDSDRVLVMDSGRIVEFDKPHILLQNPHGKFYKLVKETNAKWPLVS